MKKLLMTLTMAIAICLCAQAQKPEFKKESKDYVYCELVGSARFLSKKISVIVDFGDNNATWNTKLSATGEPLKFTSMVDAMNYMSQRGWQLVQTYVAEATDLTIYHWVLKKNTAEFSAEERMKLFGPARDNEE